MKNNADLKKQSMTGFIWKFLEKAGHQIVSMVVQIVLARLLLPEDYGIIGYLTLFINLSDVFIKQGFTTALIQKKDADEKDFSSVFYANIAVSLLIYVILYISAPYVSIFYNEPKLTSVMRILSLQVIIGALGSVHDAVMAKNLEFKKSFVRGLANIIVYGFVGIFLAYIGFGVWALVLGRLAGLAIGSATLWVTVKWFPKLQFSLKRLKSLFRYSSKILSTNLLNTLFNNINSLIIGKFYSSADLGQYQRGENIPQTFMTAVDGSMNEVMYPTFSKLQDDKTAMKSALRRSMKLSMFVVFPCLMGLLVVSEPLTLFLLTDKWLPSVPYMQLTCVICMFWPLSARTHALNALGKSDVTFKLSVISKSISLIFLLIFARFGVIYIMYGSIITSSICFFITSYFVNKHLSYSLKEIFTDMFPIISAGLIMGAAVYSINFLNVSSVLTLLIQIPLGAVLYVLLSLLLHVDSFNYILNILKGFLKKK